MHAKRSKAKDVFLPRTNFVVRVPSTERAALDSKLACAGRFADLYSWQLESPSRQSLPLFELLDGPPYANGAAHVGHAINKILKDFVVRSRIYGGHRVIFRAGWDCHGLPIEIRIAKTSRKEMTPLEIRSASRALAEQSIKTQMNSFKKWGVTADWQNAYCTMHSDYVAEQLRFFGDLLDSGLVYRAFKPVYWSPSSKTALAESELDYNPDHKSTAVFFRFLIVNSQRLVGKLENNDGKRAIKLYALVWTTTPWTLPLNDAVAYKDNAEYAIIEICSRHKRTIRHLYILARVLIGKFEERTGMKCNLLATFMGCELEGVFYQSCLYSDVTHPLIPAEHVGTDIGTGLVHTAYAHGFDDYELALKRGDKIHCFVDEEGRYLRQLGYSLEGKSVLGDGQEAALELLKRNVVHMHPFIHSYPYDWRTKKPVIIRSSAQWFIDVSKVGLDAADLIEKDAVLIGTSLTDQRQSLIAQLRHRPAWCISRQRVWGVPIPAFFKKDGSVIISKEVVDAVANRIAHEGPDVWWECSAVDLFPSQLRKKYGLSESDDLLKGGDVMDVWMDSGVAWKCTNRRSEPADLVLEGIDQLRGWFQSLLLTSFASEGKLPYKRVLVHGFAVDEQEKKMSKSIGNVVDPDMVTDGSLKSKAVGIDGLRLWVALYGSEGHTARIGGSVVEDIAKKLDLIRTSLRFLLGSVDGFDGEEPSSPLHFVDKYILQETRRFEELCVANYGEYRFRTVANGFIQFLQRPLSSNYIHFIKDRLYCGTKDQRHAVQFTLSRIGIRLVSCIAPILPHLATEFFQHHPCVKNCSEALRNCSKVWQKGNINECPDLYNVNERLHKLRSQIYQLADSKVDLRVRGVLIKYGKPDEKWISLLQSERCSFYSELVEALGVSMVKLELGKNDDFEAQLVNSERLYCKRCRKHNRVEGEKYCERCASAVAEMIS